MDRPRLEVADIFRRYGDAYRRDAGVSSASPQGRVMTAIETCRTAAPGGHVEQCDTCGHQRIAYNSCANRRCPKCQSLARAAWIERRTGEILEMRVLPRRLYRARRDRRHRLAEQKTDRRHPLSRDRRDATLRGN
jgi:hypothetical protein